MEVIAIGLPLIGAATVMKYGITRAQIWNALAAWAASNRDAALVREARRREYLAASVEEVRNVG